MKITISVEGRTPTMKVVENRVTCVLTLAKSHDIVVIKGEDNADLANRISRSYRNSVGKNVSGKDFLKLIKADLMDQVDPKAKEYTNG